MNITSKILLFHLSFTFFACNENLRLNKNDVLKYDYLKPFISSNNTRFEGSHNLDTENFEFSYKVENTENVLNEIDKKAKKENWIKSKLNVNNISYSKKIEIFDSELSLVVVNINLLKNDKRIYFEVK